MKTKKRTMMVEYWSCLKEGHHHKTEHRAQECIDRMSKHNVVRKNRYERNEKILKLVLLDGKKYSEVGKMYGITGQAVACIIINKMREVSFRFFRLYRDKPKPECLTYEQSSAKDIYKNGKKIYKLIERVSDDWINKNATSE